LGKGVVSFAVLVIVKQLALANLGRGIKTIPDFKDQKVVFQDAFYFTFHYSLNYF